MKQTLLELTQSVLSSLNSDEVNSISDTTESLQVAEVIRTAYFNMLTRIGLPKEIFQLTPSADIALPVVMRKPDNVTKIEWVKYLEVLPDGDQYYQYVDLLPMEDFMLMINQFSATDADTLAYVLLNDSKQYSLLCKTDAQPKYCTCLRNDVILFDSYDSSVDSVLTGSKTLCFGQTIPTFSMEDSFIPDLDPFQFPLLLNEAKALAFIELKQVPHPEAEKETKRQWNTLQKNKNLMDTPSDFDALPNFGRIRNYR